MISTIVWSIRTANLEFLDSAYNRVDCEVSKPYVEYLNLAVCQTPRPGNPASSNHH